MRSCCSRRGVSGCYSRGHAHVLVPGFYGWWVTVAFSVMVFVSAGVRHAVGPFLSLVSLHVDREPRVLRWAPLTR